MVVFKIFSQRDAMLSLKFGVVDEVECREVVVGDDDGGGEAEDGGETEAVEEEAEA